MSVANSFPITLSQSPRYRGDLPDAADVVVIGGGVIGICTALFAARAGAKVVVLEKGLVAAEQSSRNWGWIRQQGRDPAEMPIMAEAQNLWEGLSRETNQQIGLTQAGVTYLGYDAAAMSRYENWLPHAAANGASSRLLSKAEIAKLYPDLKDQPVGALHTASDYRAEPWVAVPAIAEIAAREGVQIVEHWCSDGKGSGRRPAGGSCRRRMVVFVLAQPWRCFATAFRPLAGRSNRAFGGCGAICVFVQAAGISPPRRRRIYAGTQHDLRAFCRARCLPCAAQIFGTASFGSVWLQA